MNKQELLTKLATECATWADAILKAHSYGWFVHHTQGWTELRNNTFATDVDGIFVTGWLAERERLLNKPSWDDAPEGATHLAMDDDGAHCFFDEEPVRAVATWMPDNDGATWPTGYAITIPAGYDWRQSLEERPA